MALGKEGPPGEIRSLGEALEFYRFEVASSRKQTSILQANVSRLEFNTKRMETAFMFLLSLLVCFIIFHFIHLQLRYN